MKRIGVLTTGGDCSGLNTAIQRLIRGAHLRGWRLFGILDGTDGLGTTPADVIELTDANATGYGNDRISEAYEINAGNLYRGALVSTVWYSFEAKDQGQYCFRMSWNNEYSKAD